MEATSVPGPSSDAARADRQAQTHAALLHFQDVIEAGNSDEGFGWDESWPCSAVNSSWPGIECLDGEVTDLRLDAFGVCDGELCLMHEPSKYICSVSCSMMHDTCAGSEQILVTKCKGISQIPQIH